MLKEHWKLFVTVIIPFELVWVIHGYFFAEENPLEKWYVFVIATGAFIISRTYHMEVLELLKKLKEGVAPPSAKKADRSSDMSGPTTIS